MCKKRELTGEPLINRVNRPIGERSIQTLMSKQSALMALIDTMTTTMGHRERKDSVPRNSKYHERA